MSFAPLRSGPITFDRIVVFGASISDPGNAFALLGQAIEPPYQELDTFLLPDAPYATGEYHFSNGATWIEQYAKPRGLGNYVAAAFNEKNSHAMNYAVGGAQRRFQLQFARPGFGFSKRCRQRRAVPRSLCH
jgi:phospholipase/lecithinase/hemolysin